MHRHVLRFGKRVGIALAGGVVVLVGVAGLVLPGLPGTVVILLGLGILSLEFETPRLWLARLKARGVEMKRRFDARRSPRRDG
jgi:uncharacterized membrane protein YbaN (DUF454 family)